MFSVVEVKQNPTLQGMERSSIDIGELFADTVSLATYYIHIVVARYIYNYTFFSEVFSLMNYPAMTKHSPSQSVYTPP